MGLIILFAFHVLLILYSICIRLNFISKDFIDSHMSRKVLSLTSLNHLVKHIVTTFSKFSRVTHHVSRKQYTENFLFYNFLHIPVFPLHEIINPHFMANHSNTEYIYFIKAFISV